MKQKKRPVHVDSRNVQVNVSKKSTMPKGKIISWIIAILLLYIFTSAHVSTGIGEVQHAVKQPVVTKQPVVVEKIIKTTKYRTEKVPFGTPDCQLKVYNFSTQYRYAESVVNKTKMATCTYFVKNEEDIDGRFSFFAQFLHSGKISDSFEISKNISASGTERFEWNFTLGPTETASCLLQSDHYPQRMKCSYLKPITYQIKDVPYDVEEKKNVTEYKESTEIKTTYIKQNETINIYTNRFFGYRQPFYLGY